MDRIDWHAGFVPAMKLELRDYDDVITYDEEHHVDNRGHRIDLLIIKNNESSHIRRQIGAIFKKYNIIEYKAPGDNPNLGDFYKTLAYACLYFNDRTEYDLYGRESFTATLISSNRPTKLLAQFERDGIRYSKIASGIYVLLDMIPFKTQIVIISELPESYRWLKTLKRNATLTDITRLLKNTEYIESDRKSKGYADKVANVFFSANAELFNRTMEDSNMCEFVEKYFAELHKNEMKEKDDKISKQAAQISEQTAQISEQTAQISNLISEIDALKSQIAQLQKQSTAM